ncbi:hypothetical protein V2J09_001713 [Rumex salicifolius]
MGSSESGGGTGLLDTRIGSIVWVRRRNGSWWPGKILGTDELSASHLMSPRSGTPVKLLGREDASVDWYNLEKSKRVKTFRCGEFDDCIERAEASLGLPAKKREKYARREDAILHALELEKELIEKKIVKVVAKPYVKTDSCGTAGKNLHASLGAVRNGNSRLENMELQQYHRRVIPPIEDECISNLLSTQKHEAGAWKSSVKSENNSLIGGSQDFTLPKKIASVALSPLRKATSGDQGQAVSPGGDSGNSTDNIKGLLDMSFEESTIKFRDRRRPLDQLLQNSTTWPDHSLHPEDDTFSLSGVNNLVEDAKMKRRKLMYMHSPFTDIMDIKGDPYGQMKNFASHQEVGFNSHVDAFQKDATSESSEDTESNSASSETDSMEHYPNVEMISYPDINTPMELQSTALNYLHTQGDHASSGGEEFDESFLKDTPPFHQKNPVSLDVGFSRWQMKGKRNARSFSKRSMDNKFTHGPYLEPSALAQRPSSNLSYYHCHDGNSNDVDFIEDDPEAYVGGGYGRRGHMWKSQAASGSNRIEWEELTLKDSSFGGYWGDGFGGFNPQHRPVHDQELVYDVDLKVQANHRREHVPFVSLMSRLNGKPIIGHPIQIETLGDGSTDSLVSSIDAFDNFESDDGNLVPPVWTTARKTARRTANFRVPRPHLAHLDDDDEESQFTKSVSGTTYAKKKNMARRKSLHAPKLPLSERKKPQKRSSSSSSQKIRPLSSLGMDQKLVSVPKHGGLKGYMAGVIKPLDSGPPIVACIPVKLVFSRLLEAIGRPSSNHKGFSEQQ